MKTICTLSTKGARAIAKDGTATHEEESYSDESGTVTLFCSTDEREEFERAQALAGYKCNIDADVLEPVLFGLFAMWLQGNAGLKIQFVGHNP